MGNIILTPSTRKVKSITCPACGAPLHPPVPHSCGKAAIERRITSALERASKRGHYALHIGHSPYTGAESFFVRSTSGAVYGYAVSVFDHVIEGAHQYLPGLFAKCECQAAQRGYPCDHGAKAARAAARRQLEAVRTS